MVVTAGMTRLREERRLRKSWQPQTSAEMHARMIRAVCSPQAWEALYSEMYHVSRIMQCTVVKCAPELLLAA